MRVRLYPADGQDENGFDDFLDLLQRRTSVTLAYQDAETGKIEITGNLDEVVDDINTWLDQREGRSAAPTMLCDPMLIGKASGMTITIREEVEP